MNDVTITISYDQHLLLREAVNNQSISYSRDAEKCKKEGDVDGYERNKVRSTQLLKVSLKLMKL